MPQAVLQKVGAAGMPQLLLSAAPRLATSLNSNKLSIKVTSSSGASGKFLHLRIPWLFDPIIIRPSLSPLLDMGLSQFGTIYMTNRNFFVVLCRGFRPFAVILSACNFLSSYFTHGLRWNSDSVYS